MVPQNNIHLKNDQVSNLEGQTNQSKGTYSGKKWSDIKLLVQTSRRHGAHKVNPIKSSSQ